jgi:hypothetical protein
MPDGDGMYHIDDEEDEDEITEESDKLLLFVHYFIEQIVF